MSKKDNRFDRLIGAMRAEGQAQVMSHERKARLGGGHFEKIRGGRMSWREFGKWRKGGYGGERE